MKNAKNSRGVIVVALTFALVITAVLATMMNVHRQRAPMIASNLRRMQAANYIEAAMYETFNRFRSNVGVYGLEWNIAAWPPTTPAAGGINLVDPGNTDNYLGGQPIVEFTLPDGQVIRVEITVVPDSGKDMVRATLDYTHLPLQRRSSP